ncbi:hypothetical protein GCM10010254_68380 [Streptomyces chromofuscus]|nr:hypothetical protein GCM10010254_68380 [Streptomyces chromofuscus]
MITAQHLTKRYGDKTVVTDLPFTVRPGTVTGFLGPNGAGKSTTLRMVLGLDAPTRGHATIGGRAYAAHPAPLTEAGALLEARSVHPGRTAYHHLTALALTHGIPRGRVTHVLDLTGLSDVGGRRVKGFSLGMGQRLGIAAALLGDPATVILDEPVNGLDPEGVLWIRTLLKSLAAQGRTVAVSSHLMSEMALTADHLIIIGRGRLLADTTVADFVRDSGAGTVKVVTPEKKRPHPRTTALHPRRRHHHRHPRHPPRPRHGRGTHRPHRRRPRRSALRTHRAPRLPGGGLHGPHARLGGVRRDPRRSRSMTTTTGPYRVTPARVLHAEWHKLRTLRSSWISLVPALTLTLATGLAIGASYESGDADEMDAVLLTLLGMQFTQIIVGVLGILATAGEHSTGQIRSTMTAVPRRLPVLWSKAAVIGTVSFATVLATAGRTRR